MNVKTLSRVALHIQIKGINIIITVPQENEKSLKEIETSPETHVRLIQYVPLNMKFAALDITGSFF